MNSLYNGQSLSYTGSANPYGLIQQAGKRRKIRKGKKTHKRMTMKRKKKMRKTRKSKNTLSFLANIFK